MLQLVLATQNTGKVKEMTELLQGLPYTIITAKEAGFTSDIDETGATFQENAGIKAEAISQALNTWAVADDSGLVVDALDGAPGVHSARFSGEGATDASNNAKLLQLLANVPANLRTASFVSVIALARPSQPTMYFYGVCEGSVLETALGEGGFGYDPLFLPSGEEQTYAELSAERKNAISHRGIAMRKLSDCLQNLEIFESVSKSLRPE